MLRPALLTGFSCPAAGLKMRWAFLYRGLGRGAAVSCCACSPEGAAVCAAAGAPFPLNLLLLRVGAGRGRRVGKVLDLVRSAGLPTLIACMVFKIVMVRVTAQLTATTS